MLLSPVEKIMGYLQDDPRVTGKEYMSVTDPILYISKLLELLYLHPECLLEIKQRIYVEKKTAGPIIKWLRGGQGFYEIKIQKLARIKGYGDNLKKYFPEILEEKDASRQIIDLCRLETDVEYRKNVLKQFHENEVVRDEVCRLVNLGCQVVADLLLNGYELSKDGGVQKNRRKE